MSDLLEQANEIRAEAEKMKKPFEEKNGIN